MAIQVKAVTLSSAQILLLTTTPQVVLAAAPAGYVHTILGITHKLNYNTIAYATAVSIDYYTDNKTNGIIFTDTSCFLQAAATEKPARASTNSNTILSTAQALSVTANANPTAGNSTLTIYVIYEEKLLG